MRSQDAQAQSHIRSQDAQAQLDMRFILKQTTDTEEQRKQAVWAVFDGLNAFDRYVVERELFDPVYRKDRLAGCKDAVFIGVTTTASVRYHPDGTLDLSVFSKKERDCASALASIEKYLQPLATKL